MVLHNNPSIVERAQRVLNTKGSQAISDQVEDKIQIVLPLHPITRIVRAAGVSTTGSLTVYTTPTDKDFYLTGFFLAMAKDAACDANGGVNLQAVIDGVTREIGCIAVLTLSADNQTINADFNNPIKLDRGSIVSFTGTFTAGAMRRVASIRGYTEETTSS